MINFQLNTNKNIFLVILSLQISIISLFFLDRLSINIPLLQEFLSLIYLLFIPGFLILKFLKVKNICLIENVIYSLGLSLSFLMFLGISMNFLYPLIGIKNPISFESIFFSVNGFTILMIITTFKLTKTWNNHNFLKNNCFKHPAFHFLLILPFISILGTYIMNIFNMNTLIMILIVILSLIPILIAWQKIIPKKLYPMAIFMISLSLLLSSSLISFYLWGWDIQFEYYLSNLVLTDNLWNYKIPVEYNAMLSVVILAPIISIFTGIKLIWVFKIVYPLIFAFVPLALYKIFKTQTNSKIAFLSSFFFISFFGTSQTMLQLARQEIAEIFLVLILMLLTNDYISKIKRSILVLTFCVSLIVSHYGLSYIFIFTILISLIFIYIYKKFIINKQFESNEIISSTLIFFVIIAALSWYMYISSSISFEIIVKLISHISSSFNEFFNPDVAQGYAILISKPLTFSGHINKYIQIIAQTLIVIGIISIILNYVKINLKLEYLGLIIGGVIICFLAIFTPYLASALNTSRLYQIALIFLSVFCIIGGLSLLKLISRNKLSLEKSLKILSIFLTVFILINTGFVNQLFNEPTAVSLTNNVDYPKFNQKEVAGANWLDNYSINKNKIYADDYKSLLILSFSGSFKTFEFVYLFPQNSYIYLGSSNIKNNTVAMKMRKGVNQDRDYADSKIFTEKSNKIYDNSGSEIFYNSYKQDIFNARKDI